MFTHQIIVITAVTILFIYACAKLWRYLWVWARVRAVAMQFIGSEASLYTDKGAKYSYKGICKYQKNDIAGALKCFEKALTYSYIPYNRSFCYDWISQCYECQDKFPEALTFSRKAAEEDPENVKAVFNLADCYARDGMYDKSEFYYNVILKYDKCNLMAIYMLGMLALSRGSYDKAEECFVETLKLDPHFSSAHEVISIVSAIKGDYERADKYWKNIKEIGHPFTDRLKQRLDSIKRIQELCGGGV
jgi:tetratricopeptide (TPR) repeat protein